MESVKPKKKVIARPELLGVVLDAPQMREACIAFCDNRIRLSEPTDATVHGLLDGVSVRVSFTAKAKKRVRKAKAVTP